MASINSIDCVVIGAGVIGLAVARALAQTGHETLIIERADTYGSETSARNSEVIHAGLYYPAGSLKARLCLRGRELLYAYCAQRNVPVRACGKLIVATQSAQTDALARIMQTARSNGVDDLRVLDAAAASKLEPQLRCVAALLSPSTGIIDSKSYLLALLGDAEAAGATLVLRTEVEHLYCADQGRGRAIGQAIGQGIERGIELQLRGDVQASLRARWVINCAGLRASIVAAAMDGFPTEHIPQTHYAKGSYFGLTGHAPFSRLIYPVPQPGGLGIHLTLDLGGQARFGPDVEWIEQADYQADYQVDPRRADSFYASIRSYWPQLQDGQLVPAYAGVRPKLSGPGESFADFRIDGPQTHGVPGVVQLFGIESPGLTAALAIAEHVAALVEA